MIIFLILGNIELLLNIAVFSESTNRRNVCPPFILTMSKCGLSCLNISTIPVIYALNNPNPLNYNLFFCDMQFCLQHAFNQLMRTFFVIACADHYASCSNPAHIRAFSRYEVVFHLFCFSGLSQRFFSLSCVHVIMVNVTQERYYLNDLYFNGFRYCFLTKFTDVREEPFFEDEIEIC